MKPSHLQALFVSSTIRERLGTLDNRHNIQRFGGCDATMMCHHVPFSTAPSNILDNHLHTQSLPD
jgi:hypothetical protein